MRGTPGFKAEASLEPAWHHYRGTAGRGAPATAGGVSMQAWPMAPASGLDLGTHLFPSIRCCRFVPMLGRFVCVTRPASPFEDCECIQGYLGFPIILCRPREFAPL